MQNSYNSDEDITYAGFWVRLGAYLIDSAIVFLGLIVLRLIMSGVMSALLESPLGGNLLFQYNLKDIVLYIGQVLYFILCTYYTGTTLGKRAMNLRVISGSDKDKLTFLTVVYRETIGRFLSTIILWIGYIMIGIDQEKRGLHDILSDTRVVYARKVKVFPVYQRPVPPYRPQASYVPGNPPVQRPVQPPMQESGNPPVQPGRSPVQKPVQPPVQEPGNPPVQPGQPPVQGQGNPLVQPVQPSVQEPGNLPVQRPGQPPMQETGNPPVQSLGQPQPPVQGPGHEGYRMVKDGNLAEHKIEKEKVIEEVIKEERDN